MLNEEPRALNVRDLLLLPTSVFRRIDEDLMYDLCQHLKWMEVESFTTTPVAPYIDIKTGPLNRERLYLPKQRFNDVDGMEYALVDDAYTEIINEQDVQAQLLMIAYILRPGENGKRKKLEGPGEIKDWIHLVERLPLSIISYLTSLISLNRQDIYDSYGEWLFNAPASGSDDEEDEDIDDVESDPLDYRWHTLFMDIAQDGIFGTLDQVYRTSIHTICIYQSRKIQRARDIEQELIHQNLRNSS